MKFIRDIIGEKRQMDRTLNGSSVATPVESLLAEEILTDADTAPDKTDLGAEPRLAESISMTSEPVEETPGHDAVGSEITDDFAAFFAEDEWGEDATCEIEIEEIVDESKPGKLVLGEAARVSAADKTPDTDEIIAEMVDGAPESDIAKDVERVVASDSGSDDTFKSAFQAVNEAVTQEPASAEQGEATSPVMAAPSETGAAAAVTLTPPIPPQAPVQPTPFPQGAAQMPQAAEIPQTVEVPQPAVGRSSGSHGRVRTRLLGFNTSQGTGIDPITESEEATATPYTMFPVGWLIVVEGAGRGSAFTLFNGVNNIGRGEDQTVRLDFGDNSISRENHASIAYDPRQQSFFIGQGGKANLVRRNDRPVLSTEEMSAGDHVSVGETTLRFVPFCSPEFSWEESQDTGRAHASLG